MTTTNPKRLWAPATAIALFVLAGTAGAEPSDLLQAPSLPVEADVTDAPQRLIVAVEDYVQDEVLAPNALDYHFIRPGQSLLTTIPGPNGGTFICTSSFIYKDTTANPVKYYLSTAGHCVLPSNEEATHGVPAPGANYNAGNVIVRACLSQCHFGGQLSSLDNMVSLGKVVYARQTRTTSSILCPAGDIGNDFALVEIPSHLYGPLVNGVLTSMPVWNGPFGSTSSEGTGNVLVHHGSGITAGTVEPTKARVAVSLNDGIYCSFQAVGHVAGGDSGSSISFGKAGVGLGPNQPFGGDWALGTITHGLVGVGTIFFGTTTGQAMSMASADAGLSIALCGANTTIPGC